MKQIVLELQQRLAADGFDPGAPDGELGAHTYAALLSAVVKRQLGQVGLDKGHAMTALFTTYDMLTPRRICHFIAQCAHETGGYRYFTELGSTTYFKRYDGRADLGNVQPGDGARYRGRGDIQITGRSNYARYGDRLGIDLIGHPEQASGPDVATAVACVYWTDHHLNALADVDDVHTITQRINGGQNGAAERQLYLTRAKQLWDV